MTRALVTALVFALAACGTTDPNALGKQVYAKACASCHGADLQGSAAAHAPNLKDGIWLFGSDDLDVPYGFMHASDIAYTVRHGIHSPDPKGRNAVVMPALSPRLTETEIADVTEFVLKLAKEPHDAVKAARGQIVFDDEGECFDCHGWTGKGDGAIGSADFTRDLWLWGKDRAAIMEGIRKGRMGVCPGFKDEVSEPEIAAVSAYVLSRNPNPGPK